MRFIFTTIISLTMSFALPLHGQTNTLSHEEMFERLSKLAAKGDPEIKYNLGMFLNNGIGTKRDQKAAFAQFSEAASAGNALASYKWAVTTPVSFQAPSRQMRISRSSLNSLPQRRAMTLRKRM